MNKNILNNQIYWTERAARNLSAVDKTADECEAVLLSAYEGTINRITKEVEAFYGRYAKNNQIDLSEAKQRLTKSELSDFKKANSLYYQEISKAGGNQLDPSFQKYLKQLSAKTYILRMDELVRNIRVEIEKVHLKTHEILTNNLKDTYEDEYYKTNYALQKNVKVGLEFNKLGSTDLEKAVKEKWLGENYSDRIWKNKESLVNAINVLIPQQFVRGQGAKAAGKELANKLNVSRFNATRLVRTELNNIANKATIQSYDDSGIVDEYKFIATLDSRTSEQCQDLDGKIFKTKEAMTGINLAPLHPHCRSTSIPWFGDEELLLRISRDGSGKNNTGIYKNFKDWATENTPLEFVKKIEAKPEKYKHVDEPIKITESKYTDEVPDSMKSNIMKGHQPYKNRIEMVTNNIPDSELNNHIYIHKVSEAFMDYTGSFSADIINALRNNNSRWHESALNLSKFLRNSKKWDDSGNLYRGLKFNSDDAANRFLSEFEVGGVVKSNKFSSWSSSDKISKKFAGRDNEYFKHSIMLHIPNSYYGTSIKNISSYGHEEEVLLNELATFKVDKLEIKKVNGQTVYDIFLHEVYEKGV